MTTVFLILFLIGLITLIVSFGCVFDYFYNHYDSANSVLNTRDIGACICAFVVAIIAIYIIFQSARLYGQYDTLDELKQKELITVKK